jgi:RNA recognition motif-containing protein
LNELPHKNNLLSEISDLRISDSSLIPLADLMSNSGEKTKFSWFSDSREEKISPKKIFVGGLSAHVTQSQLLSYFSQFGNVLKIELIRNKKTNYCKGYGFVTCESQHMVDKIRQVDNHQLGGRRMDIGLASDDKAERKQLKKNTKVRKVFICGIEEEITDKELEQAFR